MIETIGWLFRGVGRAVHLVFAQPSLTRRGAFLRGVAIHRRPDLPGLAAFHSIRWIANEGSGAAVFSLLAWYGLQRLGLIALGWLLHGVWDFGLHLAIEQPVIGVVPAGVSLV